MNTGPIWSHQQIIRSAKPLSVVLDTSLEPQGGSLFWLLDGLSCVEYWKRRLSLWMGAFSGFFEAYPTVMMALGRAWQTGCWLICFVHHKTRIAASIQSWYSDFAVVVNTMMQTLGRLVKKTWRGDSI